MTIAPDSSLFTNTPVGLGGSLATELAFEVTGSTFVSATENSADWPFENPGFNPFNVQNEVTFGVESTSTTVFAALGTNVLTSGNAINTLVIETLGSASTTLSWGGQTLLPGTPEEFIGSRIAQDGVSFDEYQGSLTLSGGGLLCDFDMDSDCDLDDIDALNTDIAQGNDTSSFDLTGDGIVDVNDQAEWLVLAGEENIGPGRPYIRGDANLDGFVDASDFNIWNNSRFTTTSLWSEGDFNADGVADASDFNVWNGNAFTASDNVSAVPEPGTISLPTVAICGLVLLRRRSR